MTIFRSLLLFVLAALAEIGGAWLIWQGWREHKASSGSNNLFRPPSCNTCCTTITSSGVV